MPMRTPRCPWARCRLEVKVASATAATKAAAAPSTWRPALEGVAALLGDTSRTCDATATLLAAGAGATLVPV